MSFQVNGLNTIPNYSKPQVNTSFKANPVATTNTLEKTPTTDNFTKPYKNKTKKTLLTIAGLALVTVAGIWGIRAYKNNYINRAQKTFQEVFMRDNITKEETIEMLKRYKEIQKIKDKDEYMQKLFEEVKKNYGFKDGCLELKTFTTAERKDVLGFVQKLKHFVNINKDADHKQLLKIMHHEMKHKQQEYFMMNYSGDVNTYLKNISHANITDKELNPEFIQDILGDNKKWLEQFNLKKLEKNKVPEKYKEYVEKLLKDVKTYKEVTKANGTEQINYYDNFLEVDARNAGSKIAKLLGGFIPV